MTSSEQTPLILFENITHISKIVTEKIQQKYLKSFLETTLLQNNIPITKNTKVYYNYLVEAKIYEIYIFETISKKPILEFQLIKNYLKFVQNKQQKYQLFITENFFAVLKDEEFFVAKENKNYPKEDIEKYIEFTYQIGIDEIFLVDKEEFKKLKKDTLDIKSLKIIEFNKDFNLYYLFGFMVFLIIFCITFFTLKNTKPYSNKNQIEQLQRLKTQYKQLQLSQVNNQKISLVLIDLFSHLKLNNIVLKSLQYDKKIKAILNTNSTNLTNLITSFDKKIKIIKIQKDTTEGILVEIEIEL